MGSRTGVTRPPVAGLPHRSVTPVAAAHQPGATLAAVTARPPSGLRLTEEQRLLRDAVRTLADERIAPRAADIDRSGEFPWDVKALLAEKGYDQDYGARPLRRVIQSEVEDRLSDGFLAGQFKEGDTIVIDLLEGNLDFRSVRNPEAPVIEEPVLA